METEKPVSPPTQTPATPPPTQPVVVKKSNNMPLVGAIIFLALVVAAAAIFLGMQKSQSPQATSAPTPTPIGEQTQTATPTPSPTEDLTANWEIANIAKIKDLSFPAYSIKHPSDWVAKETKEEISQTLTLTKGINEIKITQIPTGGNQCIFEGEMPEGPANDYRDEKFVEVKAGNIILRRIEGKTSQSFCSNSSQSENSFGVPTVFGNITYTVSSENITALSEMDSIIATLEQK